jgi:hypothetical protein
MYKHKKAQAAMEFLMTYGWAILVVLVAIAALAYFGVFSPGKWLPTACTIGSGFSCVEFKVNGSSAAGSGSPAFDQGNVYVKIRNGQGTTINVNMFNLTDTATGKTCVLARLEKFMCAGVVGAPQGGCLVTDLNGGQIRDGESASINVNCSTLKAGVTAGTQFKGAMKITYTKAGETLTHTVQGDLVGKVEDGRLPDATTQ